MKPALYTNKAGLKHNTGPAHPEAVARLETVLGLLEEEPYKNLPLHHSEEADIETIARAHGLSYIMDLEDSTPEDGLQYIDGDTILSPCSFRAASEAAGGICQAVDDLLTDRSDRAFCAFRPPGHHAEPDHAMGFCLFNTAAIGALHAVHAYDLKRVAIVDFDVHHGNGTDTIVRQHENLFYVSTHQYPCFPGTGHPADNLPGRILNVPLPPGTGSRVFHEAYTETIIPALNDYQPDLIILSAGFDAHEDDPLAGLKLHEDDFFWVTQEMGQIADTHSRGKIIAALEGGYNLEALRASVDAHLRALFSL